MLKGIIIPLVIPSLIVAVGSLDIGLSGTKKAVLNSTKKLTENLKLHCSNKKQ